MSRQLIDLDWLLETIKNADACDRKKEAAIGWAREQYVIDRDNLIDAAGVVRCSECKHSDMIYSGGVPTGLYCMKTGTRYPLHWFDPREHFCSLGEKYQEE